MKYYLKSIETGNLGNILGWECLDQIDWKAELMETINGQLK